MNINPPPVRPSLLLALFTLLFMALVVIAAEDPANPESKPLEDPSKKASPRSERVEGSNDDKTSSEARETPTAGRAAEVRDDPNLTAAEEAVVRAHENLAREIQERKLRLQGREEASGMIQEILGKEGRISRAEVIRGELAEARRAAREDRRAAADFLRARLRGQAEVRELPPFFRRPDTPEAGTGLAVIPDPIYLHEGRRYIHFSSRDAIPAVLLASAALDRVRVQPASEIDPRFFGEKVLLPDEFRGEGAWVVSYPIATNSMISSHDILFREGSTQFADGHSYDTVLALTDAMQDPALASERFVIEGHASAEGSHADNQVLSQLRAEAIVREMVRGGVSPERLIPVGYGESEAHHPADAAESLLRQDRRVVVFRIDEPATR